MSARADRPAVSVVVPVWNAADVTATCLRLLRPTLGSDDEVIVVDNGSTDHTAQVLAEHPWTTAVVHAENLGFAAGCNAGAVVATRPVVVFLNNDTLPTSGWIEDLVHPFAAADVAATGPMSNFVSGPQLLHDETYRPATVADVAARAAAVRAEHGEATFPVDRLVGFCLAVRRDVFETLGGFDTAFGIGGCEDDDLSMRIRRAGLRLLVSRGAFVHHIGHQTFGANDVDWAAAEIGNHGVLAAREQRRPELSVLVWCGDALDLLVPTLVSIVDGPVPTDTELVLLASDVEALAPVLDGLGGDVRTVRVDDEASGWRAGLLVADGRRRALLRAGEQIDAARLERLLAAAMTTAPPTFVGTNTFVPRGVAAGTTPGGRPTNASGPDVAPATEDVGPAKATRRASGPSAVPPLVSVLVRTHNRPRMLARCLEHLAAQRFDDLEVVVVNDAGLDVADVLGAFPTLTTALVTNEVPAGRAGALDVGLRAARGELVCIVDDDDVVYPEHLSSLVAASSGSRRAVYSTALEAREDEQGAVLARRVVHDREFSHRVLLATNFMPILTVLFPRREALEVGGFAEDLPVLEDWEFWLRLSAVLPFAHLPQVTCEYRLRGDRSNATVGQRGAWVEALRAVDAAHPSDDPEVRRIREGHIAGWSRATPAYERSVLVVGDVISAEGAVHQAAGDEATQVVAVLVRDAAGERFARDRAGADVDVVLIAPGRSDPDEARAVASARALGRTTVWWSEGAFPPQSERQPAGASR